MNTTTTTDRSLLPFLAAAFTAAAPCGFSQQVAEPMTPVSIAKQGFPLEFAASAREHHRFEEVLKGGDVALWFLLNYGQKLPVAIASRSGDVKVLEEALDPKIGDLKAKGELGELPLRDFLVHPQSRAQGLVVVHRGKVVFEEYPGMRETDPHVWMSCAKTTASLVLGMLEAEGKLDVSKPIEHYMPDWKATAWAGTSVRDILDMATGMDVLETAANRANPKSTIARFNYASNEVANPDGVQEGLLDVMKEAKREKPPGQAFDYSSVNTVVLGLIAEAIEKKPWHEIFRERVWSKLGAEGDAQVGITDGIAHCEGIIITRLRDLARYGMLYTPSWDKAAREKVVSDAYIKKVQTDGRKELFLKGELGSRLTNKYFPASPPSANAWQWDGVFDDGDFYKAGTMTQGLYVSPAKDLVVVWFSTIPYNDLTRYARAIALHYAGVK